MKDTSSRETIRIGLNRGLFPEEVQKRYFEILHRGITLDFRRSLELVSGGDNERVGSKSGRPLHALAYLVDHTSTISTVLEHDEKHRYPYVPYGPSLAPKRSASKLAARHASQQAKKKGELPDVLAC